MQISEVEHEYKPVVAPLMDSASLTQRHREVLSVVLDLMVEEGDGFSLAKVCRRASCSKETLYKWFGDRDGLLTHAVQWQASKVTIAGFAKADISRDHSMTAEALREMLTAFAVNWLDVIAGDLSAALNRLAISHAGNGKSRLGEIVLKNGPLAIISRLRQMFQDGEAAGLLSFSEPEHQGGIDAALRSFFGLVVADWQIRKLLGETTRPSKSGIEQISARAVDQFLRLYGAS